MARSCTEANIPQDAVAVPVDTLLIVVQGRIDVDVPELFLRVRLQLQQATNGLGVDIHFVLGRPIMLVMASISTASVAAKNARADSDVDVAALAETPLDAGRKIRLISDIAPATGRPVDLIDLATVGAPLLGQILRHGVRIHGDAALHAQWVTRHIFNNEDFMPYVKRMPSGGSGGRLFVERKLDSL